MSNLSELLPTGGGQNAVDFVASGTLSSGQTVALKTDGTVEVVAGRDTQLTSATQIAAAGTSQSNRHAAVYDSTNNKIVVALFGYAYVGTISGSSISFGSGVQYETGTVEFMALTFDSANGKVVFIYRDEGNSNYGTARIGTVSGTSISFGSHVIFESSALTAAGGTFDSSSNKVVVFYEAASNSYLLGAKVGTVSGTSISFGSLVSFGANTNTSCLRPTFDTSTNKVVLAYLSTYLRAFTGTVSGTSISFGASSTAEAVTARTATSYPTIYDSVNNKIVVAWIDSATQYGRAAVGTISGTSISFGTPTTFLSETLAGTVRGDFDVSSGKVILISTNATKLFYSLGTVSGTDITFETEVEVVGLTNYASIDCVYDSQNEKTAINYIDTSTNAQTNLLTVGFSNSADFIGITAEAISDTATGAVNVYGGINEAQTGLTIGSDYYVQSDGSLSTATSTVKAGQAISATTINMMDLT
jgi:hypothetical protein